MNKMGLDTDVPGEPLRFVLKNKDPGGAQDFLVQVGSQEEKDLWMKTIKNLLDTQNDFLKGIIHFNFPFNPDRLDFAVLQLCNIRLLIKRA